uniref:DUF1985 domain-containing protein n=1 Tax=Cannabis sativa TaxID=3483 RepID=A0A803QK51_CANSA
MQIQSNRVFFGDWPLNLLPKLTKRKMEEKENLNRLIVEYFNGDPSMSFSQLRRVFESCIEADDVYKLGIALFAMSVLSGKEEKTIILPFMIKMAYNFEFFYEYWWGKIAFNKLIETCNKYFIDVKNHMNKKIEKRTSQKEAKYSACSYAVALHYWAYESVLELGNEFAIISCIAFP